MKIDDFVHGPLELKDLLMYIKSLTMMWAKYVELGPDLFRPSGPVQLLTRTKLQSIFGEKASTSMLDKTRSSHLQDEWTG